MPFDFPASPSIGQIYDTGTGMQFVWDAEKWKLLTSASAVLVKTALPRNLFLNPTMQIGQENGDTASPNQVAAQYFTADMWETRWSTSTGAGNASRSTGLYSGYGNKVSVFTVSTAKASLAAGDYCLMTQKIEGYNIIPLQWGTANAKPIVIRLGVLANITGTFSFRLTVASGRCYVHQFTIPVANVWTEFIVPIPGDPTAAPVTDNTVGLQFDICWGVGTTYQAPAGTADQWQNGNFYALPGQTNLMATVGNSTWVSDVGLYIDPDNTGLAPPFEVPNFGDELVRCQRYWEQLNFSDLFIMTRTSGGQGGVTWWFNTTKRAPPTITFTTSGTGVSAYMPMVNGVEFLQSAIALAAIQSGKANARM